MVAESQPYLKSDGNGQPEMQQSRPNLLSCAAQIAEDSFCRDLSSAFSTCPSRRTGSDLGLRWSGLRGHRRRQRGRGLRALQIVVSDVLVKSPR